MSLPILKVTTVLTPAAAVRHWLQSELVLSQAMVESANIQGGQVFCDPTLVELAAANRVVDAYASDIASMERLLNEVEHHFTARGSRCRQWLINPTLSPEVADYVDRQLSRQGFVRRRIEILTLRQRPSIATAADVQIVPARASYEQAAALFDGQPCAEAIARWLDEPRLDSLLALEHRSAIGHGSVLSLGQVGRVLHLFVAAPQRRRGVGQELLRRCIEICSRSLFQTVVAVADDPATESLLMKGGFAVFAEATIAERK